MASFKRHIEIAAAGSGILSTACLGSNLISPIEAIVLWITGTFGGILPDIDSDNSSSLKIVFNIISLLFIVICFFFMYTRYTILVIFGGCTLIYCLTNIFLRPLFESITVHRGICHSIFTGLFISIASVDLSYYLGEQTTTFSWMIGIFLLFGFLIHLVLDEIYSIDISNNRIKRSFGTALKLFDYKNLSLSIIMVLATLIGYKIAPSSKEIYQVITDINTYTSIKKSFFTIFL